MVVTNLLLSEDVTDYQLHPGHLVSWEITFRKPLYKIEVVYGVPV